MDNLLSDVAITVSHVMDMLTNSTSKIYHGQQCGWCTLSGKSLESVQKIHYHPSSTDLKANGTNTDKLALFISSNGQTTDTICKLMKEFNYVKFYSINTMYDSKIFLKEVKQGIHWLHNSHKKGDLIFIYYSNSEEHRNTYMHSKHIEILLDNPLPVTRLFIIEKEDPILFHRLGCRYISIDKILEQKDYSKQTFNVSSTIVLTFKKIRPEKDFSTVQLQYYIAKVIRIRHLRCSLVYLLHKLTKVLQKINLQPVLYCSPQVDVTKYFFAITKLI